MSNVKISELPPAISITINDSIVLNQSGTTKEASLTALQEFITEDLSMVDRSQPFGVTGQKILVGDKLDAYYGYGGIAELASGKWINVYRKGTIHGTENGAEVRARDSNDKGITWSNDRLIYTSSTSDARPDKPLIMDNNRFGFFINRADATGAIHNSPRFYYTDNEGINFSYVEVTTTSPYTFSSGVGAIMEFPAHKTYNAGYIVYGTLNAGIGLDALKTEDNGLTWSEIINVAFPDDIIIERISENTGIRIGNENKWIFFCRSVEKDATWSPFLVAFVTDDMLNWGTNIDSGLPFTGIPPSAIYDPETENVSFMCMARADRPIDGLEHHMLVATANASDLYNAGGIWSSVGVDEYSVLSVVPDWATGYIAPFISSQGIFATYTAGERTEGTLADQSTVCLIGNFTPTSGELSKFRELSVRRQRNIKEINMVAHDNEPTTFPLKIENLSKTASTVLSSYGMEVDGGGGEFNFDFSNCDVGGNFGGNVSYTYGGDVALNITGDVDFDLNGEVRFQGLNYWYGTLDANIDGLNSMLHLPVASSTIAAIRTTSAGTTSSRKHFTIHNDNNEVGSISASGSSTVYATTSDPRLKSDFEDVSTLDVWDKFNKICGAIGEYHFKSDVEQVKIIGFNARKIIEENVCPSMGIEGNGDPDAKIGSVFVNEDGEKSKVTPSSVDPSKAIALIMLAVADLKNDIDYLRKGLHL